ncbi:MAG: hypothetical protein ABJN62_03550 [Halioglobus sp.]
MEGVHWAFGSFRMYNWHPLTWISYMIDVSLFGVNPGAAHIHNMLLHALVSLLVYFTVVNISRRRWDAYLLSVIFLVHPLHVESVAWIAERKDLLCAVFFLSSLLFYDKYRARPTVLRYMGVMISFSLALLAKPMAVTLPVVLLIFDFFIYRNNLEKGLNTARERNELYVKVIIEKLPLMLLSIVSSAITIVAQDTALVHIEQYPIEWRLATAANAYVTYLIQFFAPINLSVYYPLPSSYTLSKIVLASAGVLAVALFLCVSIKKRPLIAAGLSFYIVTLLPVIGLVQVGSQAHADRYMYIPSIGLLIAIACIMPAIHEKRFKVMNTLTIIFIVYLSIICYWQVSYWKDRNAVFSRALDIDSENYMAHIQLASDYWVREMLDESREHLLTAMSLAPHLPDAYVAMGNIALVEKDYVAAEALYKNARLRGLNSSALQINLGISLAEQGLLVEAKAAFESALETDPNSALARKNLRRYIERSEK